MKTETAYNHMYDIAFTIISYQEDGRDITPAQVRLAVVERIASLTDHEIFEAIGWCDTYALEESDANS
jgi:hypothetical protein